MPGIGRRVARTAPRPNCEPNSPRVSAPSAVQDPGAGLGETLAPGSTAPYALANTRARSHHSAELLDQTSSPEAAWSRISLSEP